MSNITYPPLYNWFILYSWDMSTIANHCLQFHTSRNPCCMLCYFSFSLFLWDVSFFLSLVLSFIHLLIFCFSVTLLGHDWVKWSGSLFPAWFIFICFIAEIRVWSIFTRSHIQGPSSKFLSGVYFFKVIVSVNWFRVCVNLLWVILHDTLAKKTDRWSILQMSRWMAQHDKIKWWMV